MSVKWIVSSKGTMGFVSLCSYLALLSVGTLHAQIITTVAGNGVRGYGGDGDLATSASLDTPWGVAVDGAGNLFIADFGNHRIRRVDGVTGIITTVAGNGGDGFCCDGAPATSANLNFPEGVAVDGAGNLFIVDRNNHRIRFVDGVTGIITTMAGNGVAGFCCDWDGIVFPPPFLPTEANLDLPRGVALDGAGNLFIADSQNHRIRFTPQGFFIATAAGNGVFGYGGDGGPATSANFRRPTGVAVDASGNLFIADSENHRIRRVDGVSIIITVAGNGVAGFGGDGGPGGGANLNNPQGVAVDASGNLFIADTYNNRIRKVAFAP